MEANRKISRSKHSINTPIPDAVYAALREMAVRSDRSVAAEARIAIGEYVELELREELDSGTAS